MDTSIVYHGSTKSSVECRHGEKTSSIRIISSQFSKATVQFFIDLLFVRTPLQLRMVRNTYAIGINEILGARNGQLCYNFLL